MSSPYRYDSDGNPLPQGGSYYSPLSAEQIAQSDVGPKFESVTPAQLFSASADPLLMARVLKLNPVRYRALRQEWLYESGQQRRPENHRD